MSIKLETGYKHISCPEWGHGTQSCEDRVPFLNSSAQRVPLICYCCREMAFQGTIFSSIEALHSFIFWQGQKLSAGKPFFNTFLQKKIQNLLALKANQIQVWQSTSQKKFSAHIRHLLWPNYSINYSLISQEHLIL